MRPIVHAFIIFILVFGLAVPVMAQDKAAPAPIFLPKLAPTPAPQKTQMVDKDMLEAKSIQADCNADLSYKAKLDCNCIAGHVYAARKKGRGTPAAVIIQELSGTCANRSGLAGRSYNECQSFARYGTQAEIEEYCSCYARAYVKVYDRNPGDSPLLGQRRMSQAIGQCDSQLKFNPMRESSAIPKKKAAL